MTTIKRLACAAFTTILAATHAARAGAFDPALVSQHAKFVIHVDLDRGRSTAVGKELLDLLRANPNYMEFEQIMLDAAGFMPASDIADVTVWAEQHGRDPKTLMVLRAKFDRLRLRSAIGMADAFQTERYGNQELMSWIDRGKGKRVYAAFFDGRTILFAGDVDTLKRGVDVLAEPADSLAGQPASAMPRPTDPAVWAFAGAIELATTPDAPGNPVLSQLSTGLIELGDAEHDMTVARATLMPIAPAQAPRLLQLANGGKAMAELATASATTRPGTLQSFLPELLAATKIEGTGGAVTATAMLPNERAIALADAAAEQAGKR